MLIRQLEYFVAVARERHFARAAAACYVSQPALSDGLRKLEAELDVPLILRGHNYEGLTPEGERLVVWARRVLADHDSMVSEARTLRAGLSGHLRIGVVPSASTTLAALLNRFWREHPLVTVTLNTKLSTTEIVRRIRAFELDAGICYPHADAADLAATELYREREVLIGTEAMLDGAADQITWSDASLFPLVALEPSMRGRELMDAAFAKAGVQPDIVVESDSIASLHALVRTGSWVGVVPDTWRQPELADDNLRRIDLVEPTVTNPMLLVHSSGDPVSAIVRAFDETASA